MPDLTKDFIRNAIEQAGGVVEERRPGMLEVLLPPALEEIAGGRSLVTVRLDPDADPLEPHSLPATVGSPIMDGLIAYAAGRGRTSQGSIVTGLLRRKNLFQEVERSLTFSNCRLRPDAKEPRVELCRYVLFHFRVTFLSDEKRERLYHLPVNLWSNSVNDLLAGRLAELEIESDSLGFWPEASCVPIDDAYQTAVSRLRRHVAEEAERYQVRIRKRFAVEATRITDYYDRVEEDLRKRLEREARREAEANFTTREVDPGGDPPARVAAGALGQRIAATQMERERKLREMGDKYRLRPAARLTSAQVLSQPKTFFDLYVDRGRHTRMLTLAYDSVLDRLEPPLCDACREETVRIVVAPDGRLLCGRCAGGASNP